jgi:hypothetical protein
MKLPEIVEKLLGLEKRVEQIEGNKAPDVNAGLMEAMLRQQMAKPRHDPTAPPPWFETHYRD